ncbi:hypothetical protein GvMRE_IIg143 [endosymbiont GvMRE of Glomus versiforme]|nr:hypothetical protein GvMRE_IIg143 [endosymbiont GvMRE of Glomus versiforme]
MFLTKKMLFRLFILFLSLSCVYSSLLDIDRQDLPFFDGNSMNCCTDTKAPSFCDEHDGQQIIRNCWNYQKKSGYFDVQCSH